MSASAQPLRGEAVAPVRLPVRERIAAGAVSAVALGLLALGGSLEPSASGLGTHQQLGLPPCSWPATMGIPCPSCGMTTAFAHTARADLLSAMQAQPAGALMAFGTAFVAVVAGFSALSGSTAVRLLRPLASRPLVVIAVSILVAAWGYKILQFREVLG